MMRLLFKKNRKMKRKETACKTHRPLCSSHARVIGIIRSGQHLINNYPSIIDERRSRGPGAGPGSAGEEPGEGERRESEKGEKEGKKEGRKEGREG